jgi:hypothetical protein
LYALFLLLPAQVFAGDCMKEPNWFIELVTVSKLLANNDFSNNSEIETNI